MRLPSVVVVVITTIIPPSLETSFLEESTNPDGGSEKPKSMLINQPSAVSKAIESFTTGLTSES